MSKGYNDFFKAAKQSKGSGGEARPAGPTKISSSKTSPQFNLRGSPDKTDEEKLRSRLNMPPPPKKKTRNVMPPMKATLSLSVLFLLAGMGYSRPEMVEAWLSKFEVSAVSSATAADEVTPAAAKGSQPNGKQTENSAETGSKSEPAVCIEPKAMSEEDLSHFKRLSDRKLELDQREKELGALEEELHKQRAEVETRIQKLESIRGDISSVLKDRVEVDQERVKTLVEFYSNMKPKQAADIFSNLNEDLAVEVLTKMKKKNAAEIMNLLPPEKARTLSEKFTGYKRR